MKNGEAEARPVNSQAGAEARPANKPKFGLPITFNIEHPIKGKTARMRMNEKHPAAEPRLGPNVGLARRLCHDGVQELISAGKTPAIASMSLQ
jgi:hypothetical protein